MDQHISFSAVAIQWLSERGQSIDSAIDAASKHKNHRTLDADLRAIRAGKRPRQDKATAEFLTSLMGLEGDEKDRFFTALGMNGQTRTMSVKRPIADMLFDENAPLSTTALEMLWEDASHSGIRLGVAMRRCGMIPTIKGRNDMLVRLEEKGLMPADIRTRYRFDVALRNWLKGIPPAEGSVREILLSVLDETLTGPQCEQLLSQAEHDYSAWQHTENDPHRYGPVRISEFGKRIEPKIPPRPVSDRPATERISMDELADHIDAYAKEMGPKLNVHQQQTIADIVTDLRKGAIGGIVKRPTGTGKTIIFCTIIAALMPLVRTLAEETGERNGLAILVPNNFLEDQTLRQLLRKRDSATGLPFFHYPGNPGTFALRAGDVAIYSDQNTDEQREKALAKPLMILTFSAYESRLSKNAFPLNQLIYAIIDEVDMAKDADEADERRTERMRILTGSCPSSGFSATTRYQSKTGERDVSRTLYDRDDHIHTTRIRQSAEQGEVCPIKNILMVTNASTGVETQWTNQHEYTEEQTQQVVSTHGRDDAIIRQVLGYVDPQTGIAFKDLDQIWFCRGVAHADRVADRLNEVMRTHPQTMSREAMRREIAAGRIPVFAVKVDGFTPDNDWTDERGIARMGLKEILELHRQGKIPVICNADLLIRGFDSPRSQLAVMTYPSTSTGKVEQIGGRIGRLDPATQDPRTHALTNVGNPDKIGFVVNVLDHDTRKGRIFADDDIAEEAFIGHTPARVYKTRLSQEGRASRTPDFSKLDKGVTVQCISHPEEVKHFITHYRCGTEAEYTPAQATGIETSLPDTQIQGPATMAGKTLPRFTQQLRTALAARTLEDGTPINDAHTFQLWIYQAGLFEEYTRSQVTGMWAGTFTPPTITPLLDTLFPRQRGASWSPVDIARENMRTAATEGRGTRTYEKG